MKMQAYHQQSWSKWRKCFVLRKDLYSHTILFLSQPFHAPKTRLHKKKVECNYNNILALHQSTVTCTGTWSCIGRGRCRTVHCPCSCMRDQGRGCKTVRHFYCRYFNSAIHKVRTHLVEYVDRVVALFCWIGRGRIQKNASRGQRSMFTKHLCEKGKRLTISHKVMHLMRCNENYHTQTYIR